MVRRIDFDDGFTSSTPSSSSSTPASDVAVTPTGNLSSTDVQSAFEELQADIDTINSNISNVDNTSDVNKPVSTAQAAADATVLATAEAYTDTKITALINAAPAALDTLDELANALGDDPNFATTVSTALGNRLRVDTAAQGLNSTQKTNAKTNIDLQNVDNTSDATKNSATATLTNKTLTSPVLDMGVFTEQGSTPSSPSAGQRKLYAKNTGKFYQLDSSGTEKELGSGGTGINFVNGGDAEGGSIFATYKDAASTSPADGTGGIPTIASASTSSSSPLSGSNSFLLTHPASNVQGEGWSVDFTIDNANKAKVLKIDFDYIVNSGTFVAGSPSTNSDITVWILDVTNNILIQPSSYKLLSNSSTIADRFSATFQSSYNSTAYRLIFHCSTTSISSFVLKLDSVSVSPSSYVYGTPVTDWQSYTPNGSWSTNTTYTGFWRRVGKNLEYRVRLALAGAPTATSLTINYLPSGIVVDTSAITTTATDGTLQIGSGVLKSAASVFDASVYYNGTSNLAVVVKNASGTYTGAVTNVNATTPATFTSGDSVDIWGTVPISGWSSSVQMSDQADTRVVAVNVIPSTPTGTINSGYNVVKWSSVTNDTHGTYNPSTGQYTVVVPGFYRVSATLDIAATLTAGQYIGVRAGNSTQGHYAYNFFKAQASVTSDYPVCAVGVVYAKAGEVLQVDSICNGSSVSFSSSLSNSFFSFEKLSGPSAIAVTESIRMKYSSTSGQSLPNASASVISFATKSFDTHGTWATNVFTAPISGKYRVKALISVLAPNTTGNTSYLRITVNGSTMTDKPHTYSYAAGSYYSYEVDDEFDLIAGNYISIVFYSNHGATATMDTNAGRNYVIIGKVG